jgi:hypothetical protein
MNDRAKQYLHDTLIEAQNLADDLAGVTYQDFIDSRTLRRMTERSPENLLPGP